jgi:hypothetical protein
VIALPEARYPFRVASESLGQPQTKVFRISRRLGIDSSRGLTASDIYRIAEAIRAEEAVKHRSQKQPA